MIADNDAVETKEQALHAQSPRVALRAQVCRVVAFLRHVGCPFAEATVRRLATLGTKYPAIDFVAVTHSREDVSRTWCDEFGGAEGAELVYGMNKRFLFSAFSRIVGRATGHPAAFWTSVGLIAVWGATGSLFHYSDTWQLVINTSTTIITFLMVFLIQNTQNRDSEAIQVKLDELIRAIQGAHNALLDLEEMTQEDLEKVRATYVALARKAREDLRRGAPDTGCEEPG